MRKWMGVAAIFFGAAGVLLLAAAGIAIWRVERAVVDGTDRATARIEGMLAKIETRLERLEDKVENVTVNMGAIHFAAARLLALPAIEALARKELSQLFERFDHLLRQSDELGETLGIIARMFEDGADLSAQLDDNPQLTDRLHGMADALERAVAALAGLRKELGEIRLREAEADPRKLVDLIERSREPLERLASGVASIRLFSADAREAMEPLRQEVRFWMWTRTAILSLVMVWFGLGQACLIGWGWRRFRSPTTGISVAST